MSKYRMKIVGSTLYREFTSNDGIWDSSRKYSKGDDDAWIGYLEK